MHPTISGVPQLVVLVPDTERGRRIEVSRDTLLVGRGDGCDIRFDDPFVSRTHARLQRHGHAVYVQDLGSSGGTFVNGVAAAGPTELRHGDIVRFADVELRFAAVEPRSGPAVESLPDAWPGSTTPPPPPPPSPSPVSFDIGYQRDGVFHNVGRDQYILQQRESFLRHVAATRTKARWLIWLGVVLTVAGGAMFASGVLRFLSAIADSVQTGAEPSTVSPFGGDIGGFPAGLVGWALAAIGSFLIVIGIVLHIVAASRRKRVDRDYPVPFPH
ncbi:FHA domain-containing protein [Actinoplanes subtropicus]|uniref:FHA domain-containing protein n=1 Tax=Actinoplanes subtropicus TaxID=543632 RepID=UPI000690D8A0|nr:FHA domain-containing protein [Actinoplanes subtropicus]